MWSQHINVYASIHNVTLWGGIHIIVLICDAGKIGGVSSSKMESQFYVANLPHVARQVCLKTFLNTVLSYYVFLHVS